MRWHAKYRRENEPIWMKRSEWKSGICRATIEDVQEKKEHRTHTHNLELKIIFIWILVVRRFPVVVVIVVPLSPVHQFSIWWCDRVYAQCTGTLCCLCHIPLSPSFLLFLLLLSAVVRRLPFPIQKYILQFNSISLTGKLCDVMKTGTTKMYCIVLRRVARQISILLKLSGKMETERANEMCGRAKMTSQFVFIQFALVMLNTWVPFRLPHIYVYSTNSTFF